MHNAETSTEVENGWDSDTSAIILLLHLLPPSAQGRKKPGKISASNAVDHLIKFQKTGTSLQQHLDNITESRQPYLLAQGPQKSSIHSFFIAIDKHALPCQGTTSVGALDELFKVSVKQEVLRQLNLSRPPEDEGRVAPPQYMLQIYQNYSTHTHTTPRADVIRSYTLQGITSSGCEGGVSRHRLLFNVSLPISEEISSAKLRLFTWAPPIKTSPCPPGTEPTRTVRVYQRNHTEHTEHTEHRERNHTEHTEEQATLLAGREQASQQDETSLAPEELMRQEHDSLLAGRKHTRQEDESLLARREHTRQEHDSLLAGRKHTRQEDESLLADREQARMQPEISLAETGDHLREDGPPAPTDQSGGELLDERVVSSSEGSWEMLDVTSALRRAKGGKGRAEAELEVWVGPTQCRPIIRREQTACGPITDDPTPCGRIRDEESGGPTVYRPIPAEGEGSDRGQETVSEEGEGSERVQWEGLGELGVDVSMGSNHSATLIVFSDDQRGRQRQAELQIQRRLSKRARHSPIRRRMRRSKRVEYSPIRRRVRRSKRVEYCHRTSLRVNFKDIGWHRWIVAPPEYEAYECKGACVFPLRPDVTPSKHAIIQSLVNLSDPKKARRACCVPTKLDPITIMYQENGVITVRHLYEDMRVAACGCR
ncbi:growth/differentiation factor 2 [Engraulis encrasicolus]|uniref:growth/differentiation factor 2 n=1 Tax=Engraulis encrasicolus TaxID=184585 RepID=UPI002FD1D1A4